MSILFLSHAIVVTDQLYYMLKVLILKKDLNMDH